MIESNSIKKPASPVGRYLLYAIGEILLVMIGILLALQVNLWNEGRKKTKVVHSHLESLADAITHDIREQSISMEFNEFRYHSWQYLLKMSGIPVHPLKDMPRTEVYIEEDEAWLGSYPDEINKEFVDMSVHHFNEAFANMVFNYSAINEINNLGIMSDIDDSLKSKINEYYYFLDWRFGEQSVNRRFKLAVDLKNYLRDTHAISCNYPPDPQRIFNVIAEDERVVIMLKDLIRTANSHYWATKDLQDRGKKLIEMIRS